MVEPVPGPNEVATVRLDGLFRRDQLKLMKIDVEGMEADVLRGAEGTIRRLRPILYVENDRIGKSPDLLRLLDRLGYACYWHLPPFHNPQNHNGRDAPLHAYGFIDEGTHYVCIGMAINLLCLPRESGIPIQGFAEVSDPEEHPLSKRWSGRFMGG